MLHFGKKCARRLHASETMSAIYEKCENLDSFSFADYQVNEAAPWIELFGDRLKTLDLEFDLVPEISKPIALQGDP